MKLIIGIAAGAAIGLAAGYAGRCSSGACPLTGNPLVSALVGAVAGFLLASSYVP
jgi:hypothetical protein